MATKKAEKVSKDSKKEVKNVFSGEYLYATGKRKTSVAQVRLYTAGKTSKGILVNDKDVDAYFGGVLRWQNVVKAPLLSAGHENKFDVSARVSGGGMSAQADAVQLGIARALVKFDASLQKSLKDLGFLTRDSRIVERKKPGHKKARKSPQWAKR